MKTLELTSKTDESKISKAVTFHLISSFAVKTDNKQEVHCEGTRKLQIRANALAQNFTKNSIKAEGCSQLPNIFLYEKLLENQLTSLDVFQIRFVAILIEILNIIFKSKCLKIVFKISSTEILHKSITHVKV